MNTQQKGRLAQLKVEQRACEKGYVVSVPTLDSRYDLIVDDGSKLSRVQVKYGDGKPSNSDGAIIVDFRKWAGNKHWAKRKYKKTEVDAVLVYIPKVNKVCWLDATLFHDRPSICLRYERPANGQKKGIHFVDDLVW